MMKALEEIGAGLDDAIKHARGKESKVIVHKPETIDVKAIRKKTGLSQQGFCAESKQSRHPSNFIFRIKIKSCSS